MQMVDRLDEGIISSDLGVLDYTGLYKAVVQVLFRDHLEGQLKAGKRLLLITNSDYIHTHKTMRHFFNRFLPNDMNWQDLFEMVTVSARKPEFFQISHPLYEVVKSDGLMRPCFKACPGFLSSIFRSQIDNL